MLDIAMTIPPELQKLDQWVGVNDTKLPLCVTEKGIECASSSNRATWTSFEKITSCLVKNTFSYCGFVFADNGIVGIDIDDGFNEDGFLSNLAIDVMNACKSYTEYSRSKRGMHIFVKGKLPFSGRNNRQGLEIYQSGRYFIVTGQKLIFPTIIENQDAIDYIVGKYFPETTVATSGKKSLQNIYQPKTTLSLGKTLTIERSYPEIGDGSRNISLTSLAGQLFNQGYSDEAVFKELLRVNKACCKPPLGTNEIKTIVRSVRRYERR